MNRQWTILWAALLTLSCTVTHAQVPSKSERPTLIKKTVERSEIGKKIANRSLGDQAKIALATRAVSDAAPDADKVAALVQLTIASLAEPDTYATIFTASAVSALPSQAGNITHAAIQTLPARSLVLATAAVNSQPKKASQITNGALHASPSEAELIVFNLAKAQPQQASAIAYGAAWAIPKKAEQLAEKAIEAAPGQEAEIRLAAKMGAKHSPNADEKNADDSPNQDNANYGENADNSSFDDSDYTPPPDSPSDGGSGGASPQ